MTEYYVKTDGDDTKDGLTIENAWLTIYHAQNNVSSGDIIIIAEGSYPETAAFMFDPPENTQWRGDHPDPTITKIFSRSSYDDRWQNITHNDVVISNCSLSDNETLHYVITGAGFQLKNCRICGWLEGTMTDILLEDLYGRILTTFAIDMTSTNGTFNNIDIGGSVGYTTIAGNGNNIDRHNYGLFGFNVNGLNNTVTNHAGRLDIWGDSSNTVDSSNINYLKVIKHASSDGIQTITNCIGVADTTVESGATATIEWKDNKFFESSNSMYTKITPAGQTSITLTGSVSNITFNERAFSITTDTEIEALIVDWQTYKQKNKEWKVSGTGSITMTFSLEGMIQGTLYDLFEGISLISSETSDLSGIITFPSHTSSFSEKEFFVRKVSNTKSRLRKSSVIPPPPTAYGWFGGGASVSYVNIVERITLSDDTTNAIDRCDLTVARSLVAAFTDNNYGWFGGGWTGSASNVIDRITLSDDTTNAIDRCDLISARRGLAAFTDNTYGWFGGGYPDSNVLRITIANDTTNTLARCNLNVERFGLAAFTDKTHGWFGGGWLGSGFPDTDIVDRITLADDTTNAIDRCNLTIGRAALASFTDNTYGWFGGGEAPGYSNNIDRITLSDDTTNAIDRCDLYVARGLLAAFTDNTYGWFGGGYAVTSKNTIDRITLSNDTTNAVDRCDLTSSRTGLSAFSGSV